MLETVQAHGARLLQAVSESDAAAQGGAVLEAANSHAVRLLQALDIDVEGAEGDGEAWRPYSVFSRALQSLRGC